MLQVYIYTVSRTKTAATETAREIYGNCWDDALQLLMIAYKLLIENIQTHF